MSTKAMQLRYFVHAPLHCVPAGFPKQSCDRERQRKMSQENSLMLHGRGNVVGMLRRVLSREAPSDLLSMTGDKGVSSRGPEGPLFHRKAAQLRHLAI